MPGDQVILDPEQLVEGAQGPDLGLAIEAQAEDRGDEGVGDESHQGIHLDERDVDRLRARLGGVDLPHHVEIEDHFAVIWARDEPGDVARQMLLAELDGLVRHP